MAASPAPRPTTRYTDQDEASTLSHPAKQGLGDRLIEATIGASQLYLAATSQSPAIDERLNLLVSSDRDSQNMALATPSSSAVLADRKMIFEHVNPSAAAAHLVDPAPDAQCSPSRLPPPCLDDLLAAVKPFTGASEMASTTIEPSLAVIEQQPDASVMTMRSGHSTPDTQRSLSVHILDSSEMAGPSPLGATYDASPRSAHERGHESPPLNTLLELDGENYPSAVDGNHPPESQQPDPMEVAELAAQEIIVEAQQASAEKLVASQVDSTFVSPLRFESKPRITSSDGQYPFAAGFRQHDHQPSSSVTTRMVPDGSCINNYDEAIIPLTKTAEELDAAEYVIKNYYPSNGSPSSTRQGSPAQLDYPLGRQLSLRRGGSLERPTLPSQADQPWRYSDSSTTLQPRSIPSSGGPTPLAERKPSWPNANNSTPSVIPTQSNLMALSSYIPPSVGNPKRSVSSGTETTGVSNVTSSESKESPGTAQHPLQSSGSVVHKVFAPTPRRLTVHNASGNLISERPAPVSQHSSRFSVLKVQRI